MKFDSFDKPTPLDAVLATDEQPTAQVLEAQLAALSERIRALPPDHDPVQRAGLLLDAARSLLLLEERAEAWKPAREAFDLYIAAHSWEQAAEACSTLYLCEQSQSLAALGQGVWLAVTYPVNPELTVALLEHVVDDTPDDSDGAAVAATAAHYVADVRARGQQHENLTFFTGQLLARVARRHGDVQDQATFDAWRSRLELDDPSRFLPRLRNVIDVLVQDDWWIDREALQRELPVN